MVDSGKHTPGPWRFEESQGGAWFIYGETGDNQPIAPRVKVPKRGTKLMRANARLMAAAPELYEDGKEFLTATERLLDWMNGNDLSADHADNCPEDYERLCKALEKFQAVIRKAVANGK